MLQPGDPLRLLRVPRSFTMVRGVGLVYIKPHQTNPLHIHPNIAEYLHVIEGSCEHRVGDRWVTVKAGDTLRIPLGVKHNARTKDEPCRAVIVYDTGKRRMEVVAEQTHGRGRYER